MKKVKFHFSCLFFLLIFLLSGCNRYATKDILDIQEIGCNLSEEEERFIYSISHYELNFYKSIFNENIPLINLKVFGDSTDYRSYQHKISSSRAKNGFYSGSKKFILIYKNDRFLKTISHEINHFILRNLIPVVPKWINEGLSEYFEFAQIEKGLITIHPQNKKLERLQQWIDEPGKIDLSDFFSWPNSKWSKNSKPPDYLPSTLSWGIVYFMMTDDSRSKYVKLILQDLNSGLSSLESLEKNYPGGIPALEADFRKFVISNLSSTS